MQDIEGGTMACMANSQLNHLEVHISIWKLWTKNLQCKSESSLTILWVFDKRELLLQPMLQWNFTMKTCQIWCYVSHKKCKPNGKNNGAGVKGDLYIFHQESPNSWHSIEGGFLTRNISTLWNEFAPKVVNKKIEILLTNNG